MFDFWDIIMIDWLDKNKKDEEEHLEELRIQIEYDQDYEYKEEKETIIKISL